MLRRSIAGLGYGGAAGIAINGLMTLHQLDKAVATAECTDVGCVLSPSVLTEVASAVQRAGLADRSEPDHLRVFVTRGLNAMSGGSIILGTGVAVGVPRTFMCDTPDHPLLRTLKFRGMLTTKTEQAAGHGQRVPAATPDDGRRIRELLVRTPDSRGFAISHELGHVVHEDGLLLVGLWTTAAIGTTRVMSRAIQTGSPSRALFGVVLTTAWVVMGRWTQEFRADAFAVRCGYGSGAEDFLQQRAQLNTILRREWEEMSLHESGAKKSSMLGWIGRELDATAQRWLVPGDYTALPELLTHPPISLRRRALGLSQ